MKHLVFTIISILISLPVRADSSVRIAVPQHLYPLEIRAYGDKNGISILYISNTEVEKSNDEISISGKHLISFLSDLRAVRSKAAEWINVAHENNVTVSCKKMPVFIKNVDSKVVTYEYPKIHVGMEIDWKHVIQPYFSISDRDFVFIQCHSINFCGLADLDNLITALDINSISDQIVQMETQKEKAESLFD